MEDYCISIGMKLIQAGRIRVVGNDFGKWVLSDGIRNSDARIEY